MKKNSLYVCMCVCVCGKVKGQKNIDVFRVQKSKKTSSEMGSKVETT